MSDYRPITAGTLGTVDGPLFRTVPRSEWVPIHRDFVTFVRQARRPYPFDTILPTLPGDFRNSCATYVVRGDIVAWWGKFYLLERPDV